MECLIFDRTQQDVDNKTEKGFYNYTDLNRIEEWCKYISDLLNKYSYNISIITKVNWSFIDFPTTTEMERIRSNIQLIKDTYYSFSTTPETPETLDLMTYLKANDIEKILDDVDKILNYMENDFVYCGVSNCGQNRYWQQRFRL